MPRSATAISAMVLPSLSMSAIRSRSSWSRCLSWISFGSSMSPRYRSAEGFSLRPIDPARPLLQALPVRLDTPTVFGLREAHARLYELQVMRPSGGAHFLVVFAADPVVNPRHRKILSLPLVLRRSLELAFPGCRWGCSYCFVNCYFQLLPLRTAMLPQVTQEACSFLVRRMPMRRSIRTWLNHNPLTTI